MSYALSPLDRRRIVLFNYLIVFCVFTSFILGVITLSFGLLIQPIICAIACILLSLSILFNRAGKIVLSKAYFISIGVVMIIGAVLIYVEQGVYVDTENMLYAAMAISMFMADGIRKHIAYWLIFGAFISLKIIILNSQGMEFGNTYALILINNLVVAGVLYLFLYVFRAILITAFDRSDQQEQTLRSLLDNAPLLMALVDREGNFILANHNYASRFG